MSQMNRVEMISLRDYRLATLNGGFIINFEAGVPKLVPPSCVEEALKAGIVPTDGTPLKPQVAPRLNVPQGEERVAAIRTVLEALKTEANPDHFNATGIPKLPEIKARLGYRVDRDEVDEIWTDVLGSPLDTAVGE